MTTILITGANRGIGLEFTKQYLADGAQVIACARAPESADDLKALQSEHGGSLRIEQADMSDFDSIDALAARLDGVAIDKLLLNAGIFGPRNDEATDFLARLEGQLMGGIDFDGMLETVKVNAIAPLKMTEALLENLKAGTDRQVIFISSTAGSISGTLSMTLPVVPMIYPVSKGFTTRVALQTSKALEKDGITTFALCPGHVKTRLGGNQAMLEVSESVTGLRSVIAGATPETNGAFINFAGETVPW